MFVAGAQLYVVAVGLTQTVRRSAQSRDHRVGSYNIQHPFPCTCNSCATYPIGLARRFRLTLASCVSLTLTYQRLLEFARAVEPNSAAGTALEPHTYVAPQLLPRILEAC